MDPLSLVADLSSPAPAVVPFADPPAAVRLLRRLAELPGAEAACLGLIPSLLAELAFSASPDRALVNLERLAGRVDDPAAFYRRLTAEPRGLEALIRVLSGSQFLSEILLRAPTLVEGLLQLDGLSQAWSPAQFQAAARAVWTATDGLHDRDGSEAAASGQEASLAALRRFQQAHLFRIGAGDLLGLLDLATVTAQLSGLAMGVISACLEGLAAAAGRPLDGFVVLALGKLGGEELNYSSDVDLCFIARSDAARYEPLARRLIAALSQAASDGFLYRVDMRLRPWGGVGPLVPTLGGYLAYLERHARLWEKQALLRARPIAGDLAVGQAFLEQATPLLFSAGSEAVRAEVSTMKQRTEAHLRQQGRNWGEVKLGEGSIRDVEFIVQYLQLAHGADHLDLRTPNTVEALARLALADLLTPHEQRILTEGYLFFRTVEHYLQILDYRQTHTLPQNAADLRYLARRLGFSGADAQARFVARYEEHRLAVRTVYLRHLMAESRRVSAPSVQPTDHQDFTWGIQSGSRLAAAGLSSPPTSGSISMQLSPPSDLASAGTSALVQQHLARLDPAYAQTFTLAEIERHAILAARLTDANLLEVEAVSLPDGSWRVTIVGFDYLGELSAICGLLFAYGFSISDGHVFTYEPAGSASDSQAVSGARAAVSRRPSAAMENAGDVRRKIVDVFQVRPVGATAIGPEVWARYRADLLTLVQMLRARAQRAAQGELAKRVAAALHVNAAAAPTLTPVDIEIDNDASEAYTVLRISALDTPGFLYEFSNALTLSGVHISRVHVATVGTRVQDILYVTDARGQKITDAKRQRELRAATVLIKHFTHLLPASPNPESALLHFHEYLGELFARPGWPDELASLERPEVLGALARLLGVSEFLWDDFLRMQYANLFPVVADVAALALPRRKVELAAELSALLATAPDPAARRTALNAFKDREMFRIDMRHILGHTRDFGAFSAELTDLVETVVALTAATVQEELIAQFGVPRGADGQPVPLAVCVLGKCGGFELGYASDIEVMFVYGGTGQTTGPRSISAAEFFDKLVMEFSRAIWARREGIFEIDLDLRPYGKAGSLAVPLEAFRRYFAPDGPAWAYERQALIKLRAIAGDLELGRQVEALRNAFVYDSRSFNVAAMRAMRERQLRHLVTPPLINVKYSLGGLVDVEYTVQGLQMLHGAEHPGLRLTNTRAAIAALADHGFLSGEAAARLTEAHLFLQKLINALRVVRGNSRDLHVPADDGEDFAFLARRLGYGAEPARLRVDLADHMAAVQRLSKWLLG